MKIGVLTSSRADFGIYRPLLNNILTNSDFNLQIIAFGTHLSMFHGNTIEEIRNEGFEVNYIIDSLLISDSSESISTTIGLTIIKFSSFWKANYDQFDIVFCLGDRFEMLAAVLSGVSFGIKFAHIHGGEKTLGAIDNIFRHSITHASYIHFASTEEYKNRIIQILDESDRVYYTGALGLENLNSIQLLDINDFKLKWKIDLAHPTILVTFHPETVNSTLNTFYSEEIAEAILALENFQFLITMPNADTNGNIIRKQFESKFQNCKNIFLVENLGTQSYFTAMKYSKILVGNTSSGIIEAASFKKYVINLGKRQAGRAVSSNIINVEIKKDLIIDSVNNTIPLGEYNGNNIYHNLNDSASSIIINSLKENEANI
ncbi:UDP-N-acetylglucosamine 2-epimerase [Aquirufa antheringensis]|uniref:UDP-N-acetylglucosamine 2-epimerase n=1 Tax=Aquirufa antheringensis TaxID=2516559 RepID=UPI0022A9DFE2|nr:UDP-N-acetylglucosamine 2-epimerase [Aquirufa antheringensis]MCZ2484753.1 UDP-N-acetylglucosamine 2-epimerase (hydrolyzing) [Aquirufa antheringensis]